MKKRLKGLACWWLVLVMLFSTLATPAMAASYNYILLYNGTAALTSGDSLGGSDVEQQTVPDDGDISTLVTSSDGATLAGWNVWSSNYTSGNFTYEITEKQATKAADWTLTDDDIDTYGRSTYHIFEPIWTGNIDVYTGDERLDWWASVGLSDVDNRQITLGFALNQQDKLSDLATDNLIGWKLWENDSSGLISHEFIAADGILSADDINSKSLLEAMYATAGVATNDEPLAAQREPEFNGEKPIYLNLGTALNEQSDVMNALETPAGKVLDGWKLWKYGDSGWVYEVENISPKSVASDYAVTYEDVTTIGDFDHEYFLILEPQWMLKYKIDPQPTGDAPTVGVKEYDEINGVWTDITDDSDLSYQWYEETIESYYLTDEHSDLISEREAVYSDDAWYLSEFSYSAWPVNLYLNQGTIVRVEPVGTTEISNISIDGQSFVYNGEYWELTLSKSVDTNLTVQYNDGATDGDGVKIHITEKRLSAPIDGENKKTLTAGEDGTYACKVTLPNGYVLISDAVEWEAPEIVEYPVTLNANGGTINIGNITSYIAGEETSLPTDVTKAGYRFAGWYEDENFTDSAVTRIESTDTGNKEFFAKWTLDTPVISAASGYNGKYDGENHEISVTVSTVSGIDYSYQWYKGGMEEANKIAGAASAEHEVKDVVDSGTYYCKVTATDGLQTQTVWSDAVTALVEKRSLTLTSATEQKEFDGTPLENDEITVTGDGFVSGEGAEYNVTGTQKYVGSSENTFTYELTAGTNADNYEITTEPGTLTVTNRTEKYQITVEANSGTFEYNTAEHTVSGLKQTEFVVEGNTYTVSGLTATASGTDAATISVTITGTAVVLDANNEDVTDQFDIETQNGTLTITKANENAITGLSIEGWTYGESAKSPTASATFGTPNFTYVGTGDTDYTESTTPPENAGTYKVIAKVADTANHAGASDEEEFVITAKDIANAEITLGEALTYTGSELTRDFTVALLDGLDIDYTVSGNTGTNAGDYELTISGQDNFAGTKSVNWFIGKAYQPAPETPAAVNETIKAKADGKLTGVTSDMEYKSEGTHEYTAISETEIANLAAGTYLVRYKEDANHFAGADKQVIIEDGAMITVSFNSNEGTAVPSITCEYNQSITAPTEPTKENFVFVGWYKDEECLNLWNFNNTLTEDITLYAKWNDKPVYSISGRVTDGESGLVGITVTLKQGNTIIATTTTAVDGSYSFVTEDGLYNIVAEKEENDNSTIKTVKIEVTESTNVNDIVFVATDINSELKIKSDTPQIIVGGLDEEAQIVSSSNGNVDVTVKMTVESQEDITGSNNVEGQQQRQNEQKEIKKVSGNRYIQFIEINLTQSISGAESTKLEETSGLIEIIIPFEKGNKRNITVYRYHGAIAEKLGEGIGNANADGEYFEVKENHIVVYAKKFSTYSIGYDLPSGGGGSSVTRYTVKFDTDGGSNVASKTVTRNSKVAEPTTPTKDGYTFNGWYTDEALTEKYDFDSNVTKNFTLFAKWEKYDDEQSGTDTHNCPSLAFDDLDITQWYHLDTDYVIENGIFKGTTETTFEPNSAQTRAMMVTVLYRAEGEPAVNRSIPFADVDMGAYYANAVIWGQQNGIVKGVSETEFAPNDNITREQIAVILYRYAIYKGMDAVNLSENLDFADADEISEYAISALNWAVSTGLIKGYEDNTVRPLNNATRAEIAAILHRFIESNK